MQAPRSRSHNSSLRQPIGIVSLVAGALGLLLSLGGLIGGIGALNTAEAALTRQLITLDQALATTADGLVVADTALGETQAALVSLSAALDSTTQTLVDTGPILVAIEDLAGTNLPQTINATRQALDAAEQTAQVVDSVLGTLAFFGGSYNPEVPLAVAISEVSDSLAPVPDALGEVAQGLGTTNANLDLITGDLRAVASDVDDIAASVGDAAGVLTEYQTLVSDLQSNLVAVEEASPGWFGLGRIAFVLLMLWLALAQVGLISHGLVLLDRL